MMHIPSKYNYCFSVHDKKYVYNLLSTSICELDDDVFCALKSGDISNLSGEIIDALTNEGVVVEKGIDEASVYEYYYNSARFGNGAGQLRITIIPTYGCNLACPYCYQGQEKKHTVISDEQIKAIAEFAQKQIQNENVTTPISRLFVSFFGGEPLLCKKEIIKSCELLGEIAKDNGIDILFDITTNLTLIDASFIGVLKKYNISLQVTIDGTPAEHDKRRIYRNGKGTYNVILENLQKLKDAGLFNNVTIRINIDEESVVHAEEMYDMASRYARTVYFGYLKQYASYNDDYKNTCIDKDCFSIIATKKLYDIFAKHGIAPNYDFGKRSPCYINTQNAYIFDPYLNVYKCEMLQNHPECKVGILTLEGDFIPNKNFYQQMAFLPTAFSKCKKCSLLPLCGAGCPAEKYIRLQKTDGDILDSDCIFTKKVLKEYLTDYIQRNI